MMTRGTPIYGTPHVVTRFLQALCQDFAGLLKQRICEVKGVPSHRQKLLSSNL